MTPYGRVLRVVSDIALQYGVSVEAIMGRKGAARVRQARNHAYMAVLDAFDYSLRDVAHFFDRDHKCVDYGIKKHKRDAYSLPETAGMTAGLL